MDETAILVQTMMMIIFQGFFILSEKQKELLANFA